MFCQTLTLINLLKGQIYRHQPLKPGSMENILDVLTGGFVAAASMGQDTFVVREFNKRTSKMWPGDLLTKTRF